MSALADALVAAQRRALAAVEKQYAAGKLEPEQVREQLDAIGLSDTVDVDRLLAALDLIRDYGATLPGEPAPSSGAKPDEPATPAQRKRISDDVKRLYDEATAEKVSGEPSLTKAQASEIISSIVAGTFDLGKWAVPF